MSSGDTQTGRRGPEVGLTVALFVALLAALFPLLRVIAPGPWLLGAVVAAALVLGAGLIARRYRLPSLAVSLIEAGVLTAYLTAVFARETSVFLLVPTPATFRSIPPMIEDAIQQIVVGSAPLQAGAQLALLIVGSTGLLALIVDHVVITARMPLLASIGLIAVSVIPAISVPAESDIGAFILLASSLLMVIRLETRSRELAAPRSAPKAGPRNATAAAIGIGAVAVVVALVATPLLPTPTASAGSGLGGGVSTIDPSLRLGENLRHPVEAQVLTYRSDSPAPPYLRAVTLSAFDGRVWLPDVGETLPVDDAQALSPVETGEGVSIDEYTTTIEVTRLASQWLPVPFPAVAVDGLKGSWSALALNRTILSDSTTSVGQRYAVKTQQPRPTLEQIRASVATSTSVPGYTTWLPPGVPPIIAKTAREVTAGTTNDYDALIAMQRWFRGGDFKYSLDAPVEQGFDGSGMRAIAAFLSVRSGYCVHFASSFAVMARTLGMSSRVVVGYLPGTATDQKVDDETIYSVSSSQLHAWPEVYFKDIGWIAFEPTTGLGVPTAFASAAAAADSSSDTQPSATPEPTTAPTASGVPLDNTPDAGSTSQIGAMSAAPGLSIAAAVMVLLAIPALIRESRRRRQAAAAQRGHAGAAWRLVQETAIDLGIPLPASESPRSFAARLIEAHNAPPEQLSALLRAIEQASYARGGAYLDAGDLAPDARAVRAALFRGADWQRRVVAVVAPRSLVIRPGSVYAGESARAGSSAPTR